MSRPVRWLTRSAILVTAIAVTGLVMTLLVHRFPAPNREGKERAAGNRIRKREFRAPEPMQGAPAVLKQIVIIGVIALVGRKVLRIRL